MPESHPSPPEVPDFDLLRPVGRGGFGEVWLARNQATGHLRAIKLIPLQRTGSVDPARREITSLTRLEANVRQKHSNLIDIYHVGRTEQHLFYVMDPADDVAGGRPEQTDTYQPATLETRLADGPLPADECWRMTEQLLAGLGALHEAGMVHRDVKPANCLFVDGTLKLADFGLLTESHGAVSQIGTETYMPPDGRMDTRADVYAAGLVIYEMLTGLPAQRFPTLARQAETIRTDQQMTALNRLALASCQRDPAERPADAEAMAASLDLLVHDTEPSWPQSRTLRGAGLAVVLAVLAVVVGLIFERTPKSQSGTPPAVVRTASQTVAVSFITEPFEAEIIVDGRLLQKTDGSPYLTPDTVPNLPSGQHQVVFRREGSPDLAAGSIDFSTTREVEASWEASGGEP